MNQQENPILAQSDLLIKIIKDKTGAVLEYDLFSLLNLDSVLTGLFGEGMQKIQSENLSDFRKALTLQVACYYGECIRRTFFGEWAQDEKLGLCLKNVGGQEITLLPQSTAHERVNGDDNKIYAATSFVMSEIVKKYKP